MSTSIYLRAGDFVKYIKLAGIVDIEENCEECGVFTVFDNSGAFLVENKGH